MPIRTGIPASAAAAVPGRDGFVVHADQRLERDGLAVHGVRGVRFGVRADAARREAANVPAAVVQPRWRRGGKGGKGTGDKPETPPETPPDGDWPDWPDW